MVHHEDGDFPYKQTTPESLVQDRLGRISDLRLAILELEIGDLNKEEAGRFSKSLSSKVRKHEKI